LPTVNPDAPIIKHITKFILVRQLKVYCEYLRKEDTKLSLEGLNDLTDAEIDLICFKRGIKSKGKSID